MTEFQNVPVVSIDKSNFKQLWPSVKLAISKASFTAIDTELSGLGDRKSLNATSIEDRYNSIVKTAKSRAIISLGLSCFKLQQINCEEPTINKWKYIVQTFNILALCNEEYVVEPDSLHFLIQHGFDFNKQYSAGLSFYRGNDKPNVADHCNLRNIFEEIIRHKKSIIVHNGFVDMIFLYQNLYADAPKSLSIFIADLCDMFPAGICDTKYIAEYHARTNASYLEYIFKKSKKDNDVINQSSITEKKIEICFPNYSSDCPYIENRFCGPTEDGSNLNKICLNFAKFGYCVKENCQNSHDVDRILKEDDKKKHRNKKMKTEHVSEEIINSNQSKDVVENNVNVLCGHRAGFDAFMTGFTFATYAAKFGIYPQENSEDFNEILSNTEKFSNELFLTRKDFPLHVSKSNYAKSSFECTKKLSRIFKS
ncbi:Target of EGR1 protein 1 [Nymphon striatum]|nr:Target of EGR1 protein 1 [Nymphon striatum]